jgi:hypothetical protein
MHKNAKKKNPKNPDDNPRKPLKTLQREIA